MQNDLPHALKMTSAEMADSTGRQPNLQYLLLSNFHLFTTWSPVQTPETFTPVWEVIQNPGGSNAGCPVKGVLQTQSTEHSALHIICINSCNVD